MEDDLLRIAQEVRRAALEMVVKAGKGHLGGSFSCTEILVALYFGKILNLNPKDPCWNDRDRFILSKAHANNTLYVILAKYGFFDESLLDTYLCDKSILGMHNDMRMPGCENVGGSLGHGLGIGAGLALAAKLDGKDYLTFVVMGDGETQEGSVWEAGLFASQHKLDNLIAITDRNGLGSEDSTEMTAGLDPLVEKWQAFGWETRPIDGHDFSQIFASLADIRQRENQQPLMIIANTIKGKGMSPLENQPRSHHTLPKGDELNIVRRELA